MTRYILHAIALSLSIGATIAASQDTPKTRARIEVLQRDLAAITRELEELRVKIGVNDAAPKTSDLLPILERAYQTQLEKAIDQELLIKAAKSLDRGDVKIAFELLRRGRQPAAVPLILKDIVQRESRPNFKNADVAAHLLTLAILTGEDVENHFAKAGSGHRLVADWWQSRHEKITTNIGVMSSEQVAHVARRLRDTVSPVDAATSNGPSYHANSLVYRIAYYREDRSGPPGWFAEELHPALGPVLLAGMGYRVKGADGQDIVEVPYNLVHLLATMRKNSDLPLLDKIAVDPTQNSGLRLVCLLALNSAGEGVRVPTVLSILAHEKKLDRKLTALEFLYYADDLEPAADYLLEALDDANAEVRQSVLNALLKRPPPRLLKKLRELSDAKHQERILQIIAAVGTNEAQQYLADYLAKTMLDRPKTERIHDALWAFQRAVNQSWVSAGRSPFDYYHGQASKALAWWKENGGR